MTIKMGHELFGPDSVAPIDGNVAAGVGRLNDSIPTWGMANPIAIALSGLRDEVVRYAETYDETKAKEFETREFQEFNKRWYDPDTGILAARKGGDAQGIYDDFVADAREIEKRAHNTLTTNQLNMVSNSMANTFMDYGRTIGAYETENLMSYQKEMIANTKFSLSNMVIENPEDGNALARLVTGIKEANERLGKMTGISEEGIKNMTALEISDALGKGIAALSIVDAQKAYGILRTYNSLFPPMVIPALHDAIQTKYNTQVSEEFRYILETQGAEKAYSFLNEVSGFTKILDNVSSSIHSSDPLIHVGSVESGNIPSRVGFHSKVGQTYGTFQITPKTAPMFINWLYTNGHIEASERLLKADMPLEKQVNVLAEAEWQALIKEKKITPDMERAFIMDTHVQPLINRLNADLRGRVNTLPYYRQMAATIAVHSGSPHGSKILNEAWEESGGNDLKFSMIVEQKRLAAVGADAEEGEKDRIRKESSSFIEQVNLGKGIPTGLIEAGNINLANRQKVSNGDGYSTVLSGTYEFDGKFVLLPGVINGVIYDDKTEFGKDKIVQNYKQTREHLGVFNNQENADNYANTLHEQQAVLYGNSVTDYSLKPSMSTYSRLSNLLNGYDNKRQTAINQAWAGRKDAMWAYLFSGNDTLLNDIEKVFTINNASEEQKRNLEVFRTYNENFKEVINTPEYKLASEVQKRAIAFNFINNSQTSTNIPDAQEWAKELFDLIGEDEKKISKDPVAYYNSVVPAPSLTEEEINTLSESKQIELIRQRNREHRQGALDFQSTRGSALTPFSLEETDSITNSNISVGERINNIKALYDLVPDYATTGFFQAGLSGAVVEMASLSHNYGGLDSHATTLMAYALSEPRLSTVATVGKDDNFIIKSNALSDVEDNDYYKWLRDKTSILPLEVNALNNLQSVQELFASADFSSITKMARDNITNFFNYDTADGNSDTEAYVVAKIPKNETYDIDDLSAGVKLWENENLRNELPEMPDLNYQGLLQTKIWVQTANGELTLTSKGRILTNRENQPISIPMANNHIRIPSIGRTISNVLGAIGDAVDDFMYLPNPRSIRGSNP